MVLFYWFNTMTRFQLGPNFPTINLMFDVASGQDCHNFYRECPYPYLPRFVDIDQGALLQIDMRLFCGAGINMGSCGITRTVHEDRTELSCFLSENNVQLHSGGVYLT
jgi:hypothetical protein